MLQVLNTIRNVQRFLYLWKVLPLRRVFLEGEMMSQELNLHLVWVPYSKREFLQLFQVPGEETQLYTELKCRALKTVHHNATLCKWLLRSAQEP